ncbi:MAG: hypothetical protein ACPGWQ_00175, partial [Poseidonia sp.]
MCGIFGYLGHQQALPMSAKDPWDPQRQEVNILVLLAKRLPWNMTMQTTPWLRHPQPAGDPLVELLL